MTAAQREYIRHQISERMKILRRRDARMLVDVQKSVELTNQLVASETPFVQFQLDDSNNLVRVPA